MVRPIKRDWGEAEAEAGDLKGDLTNWLIFRFKQLIGDGVLKPGGRLPAERELAVSFGVSRSSLRPALKVLEIMGVLSQKVGNGSYLSKDASTVLSEPMEFLLLLDDTSSHELIETRLIVEPALAAKAAERADADDLAQLRGAISDLEASRSDPRRVIDADLSFHRTIFEIAGNRLCSRLFQVIHRAMMDMMVLTSQLVELDHTVRFHRKIFEAIRRHDATAAAHQMEAHLKDARLLLTRSGEQQIQRKVQEHIAAGRRVQKAGIQRQGRSVKG